MRDKIKVLFLDIDGPLVNFRTHIPTNGRGGPMTTPDPVALKFIQRLGDCGVSIVLSSVWRSHTDIADTMNIWGLSPYLWDGTGDWKTPVLKSNVSHILRGHEIEAWLAENDKFGNIQYAILDDDSDMLAYQMEFLVLVDGYNGIMWKDICKLEELFGVEV